jgi:CTP synthase (UTP-ammonia lyase)
MRTVRIGLIGDRDDEVVAHRAIPLALSTAAAQDGVAVDVTWIPTTTVGDGGGLRSFDGLWCVPASPYRSMEGALRAIRHARERHVPFLGTCGGFQHAVVEYARNVLGWADADHAETAPEAARAVIVPLSCALVEVQGTVRLLPGTRIAGAYGRAEISAGYHCRYGLGTAFRQALLAQPLRVSATDDHDDVRGIELDDHPFFVATLFQHEREALAGTCPPLASAFLAAVASRTTVGEAA